MDTRDEYDGRQPGRPSLAGIGLLFLLLGVYAVVFEVNLFYVAGVAVVLVGLAAAAIALRLATANERS